MANIQFTYQTLSFVAFQGKHYLWGVFKPRMGTGKTGAGG